LDPAKISSGRPVPSNTNFSALKVLRNRLTRHIQPLAQLGQRLPVLGVQAVKQDRAHNIIPAPQCGLS
jgi:hypothetical protein